MMTALEDYDLPELPDLADDSETETAQLVLFRFDQERIVLGDGYTIAGAQEYCSRDDTRGNGWFVGYYRR
jgi:hypothetical protein